MRHLEYFVWHKKKKRENICMGQETVVLTCCKEECQGSRSGQKEISGSGHQGNSLDSSLSRRLSSTEEKQNNFHQRQRGNNIIKRF